MARPFLAATGCLASAMAAAADLASVFAGLFRAIDATLSDDERDDLAVW